MYEASASILVTVVAQASGRLRLSLRAGAEIGIRCSGSHPDHSDNNKECQIVGETVERGKFLSHMITDSARRTRRGDYLDNCRVKSITLVAALEAKSWGGGLPGMNKEAFRACAMRE
jgi:hypothetical protein